MVNFFSLTTKILIFFISYSIISCQLDGVHTLEILIGGEASPPDYGNDCPDCSPPPELPVCPEPTPPPPPPPPPPECPPPPKHPSPPPPSPPPPSPKHHPPPPPPKRNPPPPPPPAQPPSTPLTPELQTAVKVIERFRQTITSDPLGITKTWKGRICADKTAYKGFICDTTTADNKVRVALVNFNGFNLAGKPLALTNFLDGLTDLIVFHVNSNNFSGQVPAGISQIPSLYELDLSNNNLAGEFPKPVLSATNLTFLDLRFNKLAGKLPPEVFTLDLDVLYLNNNQFAGKIPENLGETPILYLTLANNKLTGAIPNSIGEASNTLIEALLLNNQLSGCLPYQIGKLKQATLFDVSVNRLTGPIPHSFGCMKNLQYLNISYNQLYGAVPESLCRLRDLTDVALNFNYFTQVGPACRKLIKSKKLDVGMNCILDLPSQRSPSECEAFFSKQQSCPNQESLNFVPCQIDDYSDHEPLPGSGLGRKLVAPPRSYAALQRRGP